jgi:hypothetical protein
MEKMKNFVIIIVTALLVVLIFVVYWQQHYCKQKSPYDLPFSNKHYESVEDYHTVTSKIEKVDKGKADNDNITFGFANNPYNFDEKSILTIYANSKKVYEDDFCSAVRLYLSPFENTSIHFTVDILYPAKKNKYILYRFENKSVMYWEKEYKIVYACFCPTNQHTDRIHFFPAKYDVIQ